VSDAWEALTLTAISFVALATVGTMLAARGLGGVVAAQLVCVVLPTALWLRLRRVPRAAIGVAPGRPPRVATVGALVAGAGAFYVVAATVEPWVERVWPLPPEVRAAMDRLVIPAEGARPLVVDLAALALLPALAEELLFRGVLYGALRPRLGTAGAIVATAVAFAVYHGSIYHLVPAALGGLMLGVVRAASGALAPAVAFHFANNAGVIVAMHLGYETPPAGALPLAVAAAALVAGGWLVTKRA
jgi:membrane protease YdiL (CAAX protease family)